MARSGETDQHTSSGSGSGPLRMERVRLTRVLLALGAMAIILSLFARSQGGAVADDSTAAPTAATLIAQDEIDQDVEQATPIPEDALPSDIEIAATADVTDDGHLTGTLELVITGGDATVDDIRVLVEPSIPQPVELTDRSLPVVVPAGTTQWSWSFAMPDEGVVETGRVYMLVRIAGIAGDELANAIAANGGSGWLMAPVGFDTPASGQEPTPEPTEDTESVESPTVEPSPMPDDGPTPIATAPSGEAPDEVAPEPTPSPTAQVPDRRVTQTSEVGPAVVIADPASEDGLPAATPEIDEQSKRGEIRVTALDSESAVVPGETLFLRFEVTNSGASATLVSLKATIDGPDWPVDMSSDGWSESAGALEAPANGQTLVIVWVTVPPEAYLDERATITLSAEPIDEEIRN